MYNCNHDNISMYAPYYYNTFYRPNDGTVNHFNVNAMPSVLRSCRVEACRSPFEPYNDTMVSVLPQQRPAIMPNGSPYETAYSHHYNGISPVEGPSHEVTQDSGVWRNTYSSNHVPVAAPLHREDTLVDTLPDEVRKFRLSREEVQICAIPPSGPSSSHVGYPGYLGGGTFGYVCAGFVHGARCAVKVSRGLGRTSADGHDPQFIREVMTLSKLHSNPNIVTLLGFVPSDATSDSCLLVMEEMATSLQSVIEGVGPLPVLLSHSYIAKLCDFGGCFTVGELQNGSASDACATVEYACPTHPSCQQCSCDIYSLGLVMVQVVYLVDIYTATERRKLAPPPNAALADMVEVAESCMSALDASRPTSHFLRDHFASAFLQLTNTYSSPSKPVKPHRGGGHSRYSRASVSQNTERKRKCKQSTMPPNVRRVLVPKSGVPLRSPMLLVGS
ncbi:hypothetical protein FOZ60_014566 [Perkinsus olseni]|nr:hypothetical protein FOZ60_014566 [Perkinsus olseni]